MLAGPVARIGVTTFLDADAASVRTARDRARELAVGLGATASQADICALVVSELFTNSVRAAGPHPEVPGRVSLLVYRDGACVRVEVGDWAPGWPRFRKPGPLATTGRGLRMVEEVTARWGAYPKSGGTGKVTWAIIPLCEPEGAA